MDTFKTRIRQLRENKELTQEELAKVIGVSRATLASWEIGRREPDFETASKIADFFDVSVDYLLGRTDDPRSYEAILMSSFGERLKKLRTERGLRQEDIGKIVHVGKSTVSQWENNIHVPDLETVSKIASFLNVSVDYLLGNDSTPSWWYRDTPPTDVELEEFLYKANVHFNGAPLDEEDKEDILTYLRVKWEREKRKREKGGEK